MDEAEPDLSYMSQGCHSNKEMLTITRPHARQILDRKGRGPSFLVRIVAGGWKIVYVRKNTKATRDFAKCKS